MAREEVGVINCPFTGALSVVRKDCRGKLYFYSQAGKIAPNLPQGQKWLQSHMMPLTDFDLTVISIGAPPVVTKKALTDEGAKNRTDIPLTDESAKKAPSSIMEFLR